MPPLRRKLWPSSGQSWSCATTLLGLRFTLVMDHVPLQWMSRAKDMNTRVTRWFLALQDFNFLVQHRARAANSNADSLSRIWSASAGLSVWQASRVHISVALETHEEHLLTSHHGLIGHTCGSSTHLHISSMLTDEGWETSPWDSRLTFSLFRSKQQWVTNQHRHEHRTYSPAPGHNWEHLCKQEHHHHSRVSIKSTLRGLKLNSPCRVILPPCHTIHTIICCFQLKWAIVVVNHPQHRSLLT